MPQKKRYVQLGLTVFCTVAAILLFYDTLFGHRALQKFCGQFLEAIAPILYGSFMAYLLAPMVSFFERLSPQAQAAAGRSRRAARRGRGRAPPALRRAPAPTGRGGSA